MKTWEILIALLMIPIIIFTMFKIDDGAFAFSEKSDIKKQLNELNIKQIKHGFNKMPRFGGYVDAEWAVDSPNNEYKFIVPYVIESPWKIEIQDDGRLIYYGEDMIDFDIEKKLIPEINHIKKCFEYIRDKRSPSQIHNDELLKDEGCFL